MTKCEICSKAAKSLTNRWFQYDNGEQFIAAVCEKCAKMHSRMLEKAVA